jgi:hypothetical protein
VDVLALIADERRGKTAISCDEVSATFDSQISEWGNPAD